MVLTPKHVLLAWSIKAVTGNVELIKTLNRLGYGCSYSRLEEIDTALCKEKLEKVEVGKVPLPMCLHPSVPTVLAFDNIDRKEEALYAKATYIEWKHPEQWDTEADDGELPFESGVIAEESINRVLYGKQHNQAVLLHKRTCETLMRLAWSGFEEWQDANRAEALPKVQ